jgi:hypothetical protein
MVKAEKERNWGYTGNTPILIVEVLRSLHTHLLVPLPTPCIDRGRAGVGDKSGNLPWID